MSLRQLCQMASLLVFAGLPLLQGCSEGDPPLAKQVTRPVKLLTLDEMGNRSLTRYPGVVEASERTDLAFRIGGELKELNVQAGQAVTSGERIALLDDRDARNALSNAQSSYDLALATYRRMQISLEKGAISRAAFDEARAAFLSAQAQFDLAKDQLGYTELKAPFDGVIASVPVDNFQVVAPPADHRGAAAARQYRRDLRPARTADPPARSGTRACRPREGRQRRLGALRR